MAYPILINEPKIFRIKTRADEIKKLKYETKEHYHENIVNSLEIDNDFYNKKYRSLNEKKVLSIITEVLLGSGSVLTTWTFSIINPSFGIVITFFTALLTIKAMLISYEHFSKIKLPYSKIEIG